MDYAGGNADDLNSLAHLDRMIAHSMRDVPDDDSDDLSDTDDPDLLVCHSVVVHKLCKRVPSTSIWPYL